jgi:hypothetical protein
VVWQEHEQCELPSLVLPKSATSLEYQVICFRRVSSSILGNAKMGFYWGGVLLSRAQKVYAGGLLESGDALVAKYGYIFIRVRSRVRRFRGRAT